MKDILCPTDLSKTALRGVLYADMLAERMKSSVTLLHVMDKHERQGNGREKAESNMGQHAAAVVKTPVTAHFREGDFIREIQRECQNGHAMMVCATHGPRGLWQSLFGADMMKIVRGVKIPALVVQEHSRLPNNLDKIVMPVAGHNSIVNLLDAVSELASAFNSEIHIYQVIRPGEVPSAKLLANLKLMNERLTAEGIRHQLVVEPSTSFSVGFATATIAYAEKIGAGCIAVMSVGSEDYLHIADAEKERMITNAPGIPVLFAH